MDESKQGGGGREEVWVQSHLPGCIMLPLPFQGRGRGGAGREAGGCFLGLSTGKRKVRNGANGGKWGDQLRKKITVILS